MKNLALHTKNWAAGHARTARILIAVCYIAIFACVLFLDSILSGLGVHMSGNWLWVSLGLVALLFVTHTILHRYFFVHNWFFVQRGFGFAVLMVSFFGVLVALQQPAGTYPVLQTKSYAAFPANAHQPRTDHSHVLSISDPDDVLAIAGKVLLAILVLALVYILAMFVVFLACSLVCTGYAALAVVVAVAGGAGIIYGAIVAFMAIFGHHHHHHRRPYYS